MAANPYMAPQSRVADVAEEEEYQPVKVWSAQGRIGRLRYLGYTTAGSFLVGLSGAFTTSAFGSELGGLIMLVLYIPLIVFCVLVGIQRSHDMNWSGWAVLLSFIPGAGLIWLFKPGTSGANDYGNPPPPNTVGVKILAFLFPVIAILGILAAIAIPAYVERTRVEQGN